VNEEMGKWKPHLYRVGPSSAQLDKPPEKTEHHRKNIEPWLSAVFQSEHLALLVGSGLGSALAAVARTKSTSLATTRFKCDLEDQVDKFAGEFAKKCGRETPNFEDQLRAAITLVSGLRVMNDPRASAWEEAINAALSKFLLSILESEAELRSAFEANEGPGRKALNLLSSFLMSFASRTATRERLSLFTTNYDRLLEYGCDVVGLRTIDRFVGALSPEFRSSRLDVDLHYNPPGIRGEPRFLEGVIKFAKLHGSIDWQFSNQTLRRSNIRFGAGSGHPDVPKSPLHTVMIYPNPAKDVETTEYPYAELFRDFSAAVCRPNSAIVTYGYGFGDDHIDRIIRDALTIPSTHLVIISFDEASGRIPNFCDRLGREAQISLLVGNHFGDLATLVENYLPKAAIDQITGRRTELLKRRGEIPTAAQELTDEHGDSK
jgi:SIR2-like domain